MGTYSSAEFCELFIIKKRFYVMQTVHSQTVWEKISVNTDVFFSFCKRYPDPHAPEVTFL